MSTSNGASERRRKPEVVRALALDAGRRLLIAGGPRAITLKAVGAELGMSHANLIHHFGSAEAFQAQLSQSMLQHLTRTVTELAARHARGEAGVATIVDVVFDAYGPAGIGALVAWSALTGEGEGAAGLSQEMDAMVAVLEQLVEGRDRSRRAREMIRLATSLAFADSLIGDSLSAKLGEPRAAAREQAVRLLEQLGKA